MGNHNSLRLGRGLVARLRGGMLASLALLVSCTPNLGEKPGGLIPLAMSMFDSPENLYENLSEIAPAPAQAGNASTPDDRRTEVSAPARPGATKFSPTPKPDSTHRMRGSVTATRQAHNLEQVSSTLTPATSLPEETPAVEPTAEPIPEETPTAEVPTPTPHEAIVERIEEEDMSGFNLAIVAIFLAVAALVVAFITRKQVGPRGPEGPRGLPGSIGPTGPMGPPGISGESITGPAGPPGATGHAGRPGESVTGPRGRTGKTGAQGEDGDEGETIVGPRGPRGR